MNRNYSIPCLLIECSEKEQNSFYNLREYHTKLLLLCKEYIKLRILWSYNSYNTLKVLILNI